MVKEFLYALKGDEGMRRRVVDRMSDKEIMDKILTQFDVAARLEIEAWCEPHLTRENHLRSLSKQFLNHAELLLRVHRDAAKRWVKAGTHYPQWIAAEQ